MTGAGRFSTIELSDPSLEHESLRHVTVHSPALGRRADLTVWAPAADRAAGVLPIVVLLHGVYGSHWAWAYKAGAHRTAARLVADGRIPPLVLAMPSDGLWGDGSGYVPMPGGGDAEAWIVDDVPAAVEAAVPTASAATGVAIAGLSMGGWGALRVAGRHPARVRGAVGLSSITRFTEMAQFTATPLDRYGPDAPSLAVVEDLVANAASLPPLMLVCGVDDPLIDGNRRLHQELVAAGIDHRYEEHPGGHEWPFWARHLEATLEFLGRCLTARSA